MTALRDSLLPLLCLLPAAAGLSFDVEASRERCIIEHIPAKSMLTGDWSIEPVSAAGDGSEPPQGLAVKGPGGGVLYQTSQPTGHFAVTAAAAGAHSVCVTNGLAERRAVSLNMRTALEVDDHASVVKKEHVEAIEAELDRMKRMAVHVYEEMLFMRTRSDQQHATNESTRGRLLWVELTMMLAVLAMGLWQIAYLRKYFKRKKLI